MGKGEEEIMKADATITRSVSPPLPFPSSPLLPILRDKRNLAALYAVFLVLLGVSWFFVTSRESTLFEVFLTFALPVVIVALFFFLQAMCVSYEVGGAIGGLLRRSARTSLDLAMASSPLFLLIPLAAYGIARFRLSFGIALILLVLLTLLAIHLWLAAARHGVVGAWRNAGRIVADTFTPRSLMIYAAGLIGFALVPYLLMQARLPLPGRWQIAWFMARLLLALAIGLFAWLATIVTLKQAGFARGGQPRTVNSEQQTKIK